MVSFSVCYRSTVKLQKWFTLWETLIQHRTKYNQNQIQWTNYMNICIHEKNEFTSTYMRNCIVSIEILQIVWSKTFTYLVFDLPNYLQSISNEFHIKSHMQNCVMYEKHMGTNMEQERDWQAPLSAILSISHLFTLRGTFMSLGSYYCH